MVASFVLPKSLNDLFNEVDIDSVQAQKDEDERIKALERCHELCLYQSNNSLSTVKKYF